VLRIYQNARPDQVEAEHRLLVALDGAGLPFRVPAPFSTPAGATTVETHAGPAALFGYLPGSAPDEGDLGHLEVAGRALGELDAALARLPDRDRSGEDPSGGLEAVHLGHTATPTTWPSVTGTAAAGCRTRRAISRRVRVGWPVRRGSAALAGPPVCGEGGTSIRARHVCGGLR
jgi:Ser/Thr protein kinase RdoA (MazF antagonist)